MIPLMTARRCELIILNKVFNKDRNKAISEAKAAFQRFILSYYIIILNILHLLLKNFSFSTLQTYSSRMHIIIFINCKRYDIVKV